MSEYPTDEELKELKTLGDKIPIPVSELVDYMEEIWWMPEYITYEVTKEGKWVLILVTCGWSGNETIIDTLSGTMFWVLYWEMSERGGRFTFKGSPMKVTNESK